MSHRFFPEQSGSTKGQSRGADVESEDVYSNLEDLVGQATSLADAGKTAVLYTDDPEDDDGHGGEKIYGSIAKVIDESGQEAYAGLIFALLMCCVISFSYAEMLYTQGESIYGTGAAFTPDEKRNCVVCSDLSLHCSKILKSAPQLAELMDTERNYVKVLHCIADSFRNSLLANTKVIPGVSCVECMFRLSFTSSCAERHPHHFLQCDGAAESTHRFHGGFRPANA